MSDPAEEVASPTRPDRPDRVPLLARVFAVALIGGLAYFGWNAIESWPFTGWRLYSNTKGNTSGSFFPFRVDRDDVLQRVDFKALPDAYSRAPYLLERFDRFSAAEREAVCDAIAVGERGEGREVEAIHIYWERYRVRVIDGERVKDRIERDFRWSCAEAPGYAGPVDSEDRA